MSDLKIYYVYFHDTHFVPIHVSEIIDEMQRQGFEVHVFTCIKGNAAKKIISTAGIRIHNLWTIRTRFISEFVFMAGLFFYLLIRSLFWRPDIFYTRHSTSSFAVTLIARLFRVPCAIEVNDIVLDKLRFSEISIIKAQWVRFYHYVNYRLADLLLPVTGQIAAWIKKKYHLSNDKLLVIPNGVNLNRFSPKPYQEAKNRYRIPAKFRVVLSLGSLFPWVGIETLLTAAPSILKIYPDTLFVIGSGEEPYLSNLKKAASQAGLKDRFWFFGFIPWDEASWFISTADICIAPFIFKNTRSGISSLRVFSYLACARPVVGSDIPGLGDLLEKERIGVSFPMENPEALTNAVVELLKDNEQAKKMGERGREFVARNHSWERIVEKLRYRFLELIDATER